MSDVLLAGLASALVGEQAAAPSVRLLAAALASIVLIVLLIARLRVHPFVSLTLSSFALGALAGSDLQAVAASYGKGFGETMAGVGVLVALGAIYGRLLADSGGAAAIVEMLVQRASPRALPWLMALVGALVGLPLFFEVGLVLLMPVIVLVAKESGVSALRLGMPALAGLSAMHGLVPPHPGPLVAIQALDADVGLTLALGMLVAVPATVVAGPLFASVAAAWVGAPVPCEPTTDERLNAPRPTFTTALATILLPVALMMGKAFAEMASGGGPLQQVLRFIGRPMVALLIALVVAMVALARGARMTRSAVARSVDAALPPVAAILLIVAAGGGFKQTLIDARVGDVASAWVRDSGMSPLALAWLIAVCIRLATGSATVATVTASGILAPLAVGLAGTERSLLVLAIGAGSLFFSHVNDAGFWLVKEYFGLTVSQNLKSWSLLETILSVMGLALVLSLQALL